MTDRQTKRIAVQIVRRWQKKTLVHRIECHRIRRKALMREVIERQHARRQAEHK